MFFFHFVQVYVGVPRDPLLGDQEIEGSNFFKLFVINHHAKPLKSVLVSLFNQYLDN